MNQMVSGERKSGVEAVTQTAIAYQLLCQYTAFVAVSEEVRVEHPEALVSVQVPVEMPEDVNAEGVFGAMGARYAPSPPQFARAMSPGRRKASRPSLDVNLANERADDQSAEDQEEPRRMYAPQLPPWMLQRSVEKMPSQMPEESSDSGDADFYADFEDDDDLEFFSLESADEAENESSSAPKFEVRPQLESPLASRKVSFQAPKPAMPPQRLEIVSVTGLEAEAIAQLTQHLQGLRLPRRRVSGELVWELRITNGQVKQVILDDEQSSGDDPELIEVIRRSLFTWRSVRSLSTTVLLRVRISS